MARFDKSSTKRPKQDAAVAAPRGSRRSTAPSIEDTMFFPRLRRHAKWMFVFLAVALGGGFVLFGVGAGGTGVGDLFRGSSSSGVPSISSAEKRTQESPKDVEAWRDLSTALQTDGQTDRAIAAQSQVRRPRSQGRRRPQRARKPLPRPGGGEATGGTGAPGEGQLPGRGPGLPGDAGVLHRAAAGRRQDQHDDQCRKHEAASGALGRRPVSRRLGGHHLQETRRALADRPERPARARPGGTAGR